MRKKDEILFKIIKPKVIIENNTWFKKLFPFYSTINFHYHEFRDYKKNIDFKTRNVIQNICKNIFIKNIDKLNLDLDISKYNKVGELFSKHVDHILAKPLIEGLNDRLDYYFKFLQNSNLQQIISFTGLSYDDNFKIFSLMAKRLNKNTNFIINSHGLNNYGHGNRGFHFSVNLKHADTYLNYGKYFDWNFLLYRKKNFKKINSGSVYFNYLKKWKKKINKSKFTLLYPSGPLMLFKTDLQEISPEKICYIEKIF